VSGSGLTMRIGAPSRLSAPTAECRKADDLNFRRGWVLDVSLPHKCLLDAPPQSVDGSHSIRNECEYNPPQNYMSKSGVLETAASEKRN